MLKAYKYVNKDLMDFFVVIQLLILFLASNQRKCECHIVDTKHFTSVYNVKTSHNGSVLFLYNKLK